MPQSDKEKIAEFLANASKKAAQRVESVQPQQMEKKMPEKNVPVALQHQEVVTESVPRIPLEPLILPVVQGQMGDMSYFITTMKLSDVRERLHYAEDAYDEDTPVEERYQRKLNEARCKGPMVDYLNSDSHFFGPIVACLNEGEYTSDGQGLTLSGDAVAVVVDGQHRKKAIDVALDAEGSEKLAEETVGVVFISGLDTAQKQQLFADLNRNAKLPAKAIGILYDHRDSVAVITRLVSETGSLAGRINLESNTLSKKDNKITTLSVLYEMVKSFVLAIPDSKKDKTLREKYAGMGEDDVAADVASTIESVILANLPAWEMVNKAAKGTDVTAQARSQYICYSSLGWQALARAVANAQAFEVSDRDIGARIKAMNWEIAHPQWKNCLDGKGKILSRVDSRATANALVTNALGGAPKATEAEAA